MNEPEIPRNSIGFRIFRGRRLGPLIGPWISSAFLAGLVNYTERTVPALQEVARLIYLLLLGIVLFTTWRWFRARGSNRRKKDRRDPRTDLG